MESKVLPITALLLAAFLAGCSDGPVKGTFTAADPGLGIEATAQVNYEAATNPSGNPMVCGPGPLMCTPASTSITGHIMSLPEPDGNGWALYGIGPSAERQLIALSPQDGGMYEFNYTDDDEDLSGTYTTLELRMGDFTFATAPATEGAQTFTLAPIQTIVVTGSFKGKTLDIDVSGVPGNGTKLLGRLYTMNEEGNLTSTASFDVAPGENHYEDEKLDIGKYVEFHIHVGNSKINLYKATITKK